MSVPGARSRSKVLGERNEVCIHRHHHLDEELKGLEPLRPSPATIYRKNNFGLKTPPDGSTSRTKRRPKVSKKSDRSLPKGVPKSPKHARGSPCERARKWSRQKNGENGSSQKHDNPIGYAEKRRERAPLKFRFSRRG